jgi:hypothetical protein
MTTYTVAFRLTAQPLPRTDGSGLIEHTILAIVSRDAGAYTPVPNYEIIIPLPYLAVKTVMDMPHSSGPQKTVKNAAFKELLRTHAGTHSSTPPLDWNIAGITAYSVAIDGAATEAARVHTYLTVTLALTYPIDFTL